MMIRKRFRTGDLCQRTDAYRFDGYVLSSALELPHLTELEAIVEAGQPFPRVASTELECWWLPAAETDANPAEKLTPNLAELRMGL